jgi:hypothetical protein
LTADEFRRRLLISVDARGYGSSDDLRQDEIQSLLPKLLDEAAVRAGLRRAEWVRQPGGDGELAVLPDSESEPRVVDDYVREIHAGLGRLNRNLRDEVRLRLRVAIHHGMAKPASLGFSGQGVVEVSRLADSEVARKALTASGADLVLIVSQRIYEDTIRQPHTSIKAGRFRSVLAVNKEMRQQAWMYIPNIDVHTLDLSGTQTTSAGPATNGKAASGTTVGGPDPTVANPPPGGQSINAQGAVTGGIAGRDIIIGTVPEAEREPRRD